MRAVCGLVAASLLVGCNVMPKSEPSRLPPGMRVRVDDGSCPPGQIKEILGGNKLERQGQKKRVCVPA